MTTRSLRRSRLAGALVGGLVLGNAGRALAQGCAMCGSALSNDPVGRAISWSILFLMATPYAIVGAVGSWLYFTYRRAAGRRRAAVIDLTRLREAPAGESRGGDAL